MCWTQHHLWDTDELKTALSGTLMCWKQHRLWDTDELKTASSVGLWCVEDSIVCGKTSYVGHVGAWLNVLNNAHHRSSGATSSLLLRNIGMKRDQMQWRSQLDQFHQSYWETLEWKETRHSGDLRWADFISLTEKHWSEKRPDTVEIPGGPTPSVYSCSCGIYQRSKHQ